MRLEFFGWVGVNANASGADGDIVLHEDVVDSLWSAVMDLAEASIT